MTTVWNMAINYTTVEAMQRGSTYNIALLGKSPPPSTTISNSSVLCEIQRSQSRSYIVVQVQDDNPWDCGTLQNIKDVMGERFLDWILPWKMSPCTVHNDHRGEFRWGYSVMRMMDEYNAGSAYGRRPRARRRRSSKGSMPRA